MSSTIETYTLAGGCFWCVDAVFRRLKGVKVSTCGHVGGEASEANYFAVSTGATGHAEAVQVRFETSIISKSTLLDIFS